MNKLGRPKKQFCPRNHDTFVSGRNKYGNCNRCIVEVSKDRNEKIKNGTYVIKNAQQFCKNGHDMFLFGVTKTRHCHKCEIENKMSLNGRYKALKSQTTKRGWNVSITFEEYKNLISKPCYYCEGSLSKYGHGLDRLDSNMGYILLNVVPCCTDCNRIKQNILTPEEMLAAMKAVKNVRLSKILNTSYQEAK